MLKCISEVIPELNYFASWTSLSSRSNIATVLLATIHESQYARYHHFKMNVAIESSSQSVKLETVCLSHSCRKTEQKMNLSGTDFGFKRLILNLNYLDCNLAELRLFVRDNLTSYKILNKDGWKCTDVALKTTLEDIRGWFKSEVLFFDLYLNYAWKLQGLPKSLAYDILSCSVADLEDHISFNKEFRIKQENFVAYPVSSYMLEERGHRRFVSRKVFNTVVGKYKRVMVGREVYHCRVIKENKTQGLNAVSEVITGVKKVLNILQFIGSDTTTLTQSDNEDIDWLSLGRLFFDLSALLEESSFCFRNIVNVFVSMYQVVTNLKLVLNLTQGLDSLILSSLSFLLPPKFLEILKRLSLFSSVKVFDDFNMFSKFFVCVIDALKFVISLMPERISQYLVPVLDSIPFGAHYLAIDLMLKVVTQHKKNAKVLGDRLFRLEVQQIRLKYRDNITLIEWSRRSELVKQTLCSFDMLCKNVKCYESIRRVEPVCVVFEGRPKTMKSVLMNQLVQGLRRSTYVHTVKCVMDGKDFYDLYNDEDLFAMDDVGQQGPSQFRPFINWVSEVRYPLDCSDNNLKGTKFFNSNVIVLTTNNFRNLKFNRDDCISSPEALWRRAIVFDTDMVSRVGREPRGTIIFRRFEPGVVEGQGTWLTDFPYPELAGVPTTYTITPRRVETIKWMKTIVDCFESHANDNYEYNQLSPEELEELGPEYVFRDAQDVPQGAACSSLGPTMEKCYSMFDWMSDNVTSLVQSIDVSHLVPTLEGIKKFVLTKEFLISCLGAVLTSALVWYKCIKEVKSTRELRSEVIAQGQIANRELITDSVTGLKVPTYTKFLSSHMYHVTVHSDAADTSFFSIISGHCLLLPYHSGEYGVESVSVHNTVNLSNRLLDHMPVKLIWSDKDVDLAIYRFNDKIMTPFKNLSRAFSPCAKREITHLVTPYGAINVPTMINSGDSLVYHSYGDNPWFSNEVLPADYISYPLTNDGLCGLLAVDRDGLVHGMHVAGNAIEGHSVLWPSTIRATVFDILSEDKKFIYAESIKAHKDIASGLAIESPIQSSGASSSSIVPSPFKDVLPNFKAPANLKSGGRCGIKDFAKKAMKHIKSIPSEDRVFAKQVMRCLIKPYGPLSMEEVVSGGAGLAGFNMDSSNGFGKLKDKAAYIDKPNKCLTPLGQEELDKLILDIRKGEVALKDVVWVECLKDELKLLEKVDKPRTFRCCTVTMQILTKFIFGNLVRNLMQSEWAQIAVGMNPLKSFKKLYAQLKECLYTWDGDFKFYDGDMLSEIQHDVAEILVEMCATEWRDVAEFILMNMPHCVLSVLDDLFQLTHSLPSGSYLTAILNSLYNRFLTACWYNAVCAYKHKAPSILMFLKLIDTVYGDDKINGSKDPDLHMVSMYEYFASIGLQFTNAKKQVPTEKTVPLEELSFLKRTFKWHHEAQQIVPALDKTTITSTISWYDSKKDCATVMHGKLDAIQRESYLHGTEFHDDVVGKLQARCQELSFSHNFRDKSELLMLIKGDDPAYVMQDVLYL